jgi:tRNA (guanine-N7-)-methyltransferase
LRMRKKPNLIPRMERCARAQIKNPGDYIGRWSEAFPGYEKLHLELGCGKGRFTAETAALNPDTFFVAVERVADAMVVGMERVFEAGLDNVRFIETDVSNMPSVFAGGEVGRIYINFCDPWPKKRDAKHRLTSPAFLNIYRSILEDNGEIHFKTDNNGLFEYSLEQFAANGFEVTHVTRDLHENGPNGVMTDYESRFYDLGQKINRCVAIKRGE